MTNESKIISEINWDSTLRDRNMIELVVKRMMKFIKDDDKMEEYGEKDCKMDITACHLNGCELNFTKLLTADDFNFLHDVLGIRAHINRETGKIGNHFLPRTAKGEKHEEQT